MGEKIRNFLQRFSFRTGVIIMALCIPLYIISFAQAMLPISATTKTVLFFVFYGLAKLVKYTGLVIVGAEGWERIKRRWKRKNDVAK
ncbi:MAG: hypothetical protein MJZ33_02860 [Paludibacteraceae bacterium]|nr:hypothetical protein [Paludibacteraceae bacterium]